MDQPGFFDLQHRYEGLDAKGDLPHQNTAMKQKCNQ